MAMRKYASETSSAASPLRKLSKRIITPDTTDKAMTRTTWWNRLREKTNIMKSRHPTNSQKTHLATKESLRGRHLKEGRLRTLHRMECTELAPCFQPW